MSRADETLMLVALGAALTLAALSWTASSSATRPPPEPEPPEPDIVPPPDRPPYVPADPGGSVVQPAGIVPPEPGGGYFVEHGGRYRLSFTIGGVASWFASPPMIMSELRSAGVESPQVWETADGWLAEGVWSGETGIMHPPESITVDRLERLP